MRQEKQSIIKFFISPFRLPPPSLFLQRQAVLDKSFSTMFTCPPSSSSYSLPSLLGTLRAMCRVCHNISNPANGLVLNGTFTCFPPEIVKTLEDKCLPPGFSLSNLEECREVKGGNSYVRAHYNYTKTQTGAVTLRFLAMAFRSVSYWDRYWILFLLSLVSLSLLLLHLLFSSIVVCFLFSYNIIEKPSFFVLLIRKTAFLFSSKILPDSFIFLLLFNTS